MILRVWQGYASASVSDAYPKYLLETVRPKLERLPGFRGLWLLRRELAGEVEFQVQTLWDSMDAVRGFAGAHPERAVVEPAAAALLARFDMEVRHYTVITAPKTTRPLPDPRARH